MHWAEQRRSRAVFGVASLVPLGCVIALAVWAQRNPVVDRLLSLDLELFAHAPRATVIRFGALLGLAIVFQFGMSAIVALHLERRDDVSRGTKILWPVLCLFVGSIFLPLFYVRKLRRYRRG